MKIIATLESYQFSEPKQKSITFPIDDAVLTAKLAEIGYAYYITANCKVVKIEDNVPSLKNLEGCIVNTDELNYLSKRLDSYSDYEMLQFEAGTHLNNFTEMKDLINLSFSEGKYTVVNDFNDLKAIGQHQHMDKHIAISASDFEKLDFEAIAKELLNNGNGQITPYGVVFDNGQPLEQLYNGKNLPQYYYTSDFVISATIYKKGDDINTQNTEWLYLPCPNESIAKALHRLGADSAADVNVHYEDSTFLSGEFFKLLNDNENINALNEMCNAINDKCELNSEKLVAIMEYAGAKTALEVTGIAMCFDKFEYIPNVKNAEQLGQHLFNADYHGDDTELPKFIDFKGYGTRYMNNCGGGFTALGYVQCNDSLDEILSYGCDEPQSGMKMGGLS